jgi:hypothetical protein
MCDPIILSCPVFSLRGPFSRHVIFQDHLSPTAVCHPSTSPLWSAWSSFLLIIHSLCAMCPAPFHVSTSPRHKSIIFSLPLSAYCLPPGALLYYPPRTSALPSCPRDPTPPLLSCAPFFVPSLHAHSPNQSVIPGGSARGPPRPKDAKLARPFAIGTIKELIASDISCTILQRLLRS